MGEELPFLRHVQTEKEFMVMPETKGVRMDVWAIDEDQTLYNAEMQGKNQGNLLKRERLYQAHLDVTLLMPDVSVDTGAVWIFLNTRGVIKDDVSQELIDFLHYVESSTKENCSNTESERIRRIHDRVEQIKRRKEIGVRYMTDLEEKMLIREEAREKGREEGRKEGRAEGCEEGHKLGIQEERLRLNELTRLLIQDGRTEDILRGTEDPEYQKVLLKEYGI